MICDEGVMMPRRATKGSAGYDVYAPKRIVLNASEWQVVDLGFRFEPGDIPESFAAFLMVRSSVGAKKGVHMRNAVGLIDSDYHENVMATLKTDREEAVFEKGDRILQFYISPVHRIEGEIEPTETRISGYGSTGQ